VTTIEDLQTDPQRGLCVIIGVITAVSGLFLLAFPKTALNLLDAGTTDPASYLFGLIGMFMLLFGGLLIDTSRRVDPAPVALFWCAIQKVAATIAMFVGLISDVYGWLALLLVLFDGLSALVIWALWRREALQQGA
jgi:hypothetical protein